MKGNLFYSIVNLNGKEFILNKDNTKLVRYDKSRLILKDKDDVINKNGFILSIEPSSNGLSFNIPDNELTKMKYKNLYDFVIKDYSLNIQKDIYKGKDCSSIYAEILSNIVDNLDINLINMDKEKVI